MIVSAKKMRSGVAYYYIHAMEVSKIKVAIMGAGLSGLSCAITLEKNGITPAIFENRSRVGDRFVNGEVLLSILDKPIKDCISYFSDNYNIHLKPLANIKKLVMYSQNEKAEITGHLGFTNLRGRESDSFESQLASQVKTNITFNSPYTYEQLLQDFTHVIMATGDASYSEKVQHYKRDLTVTLKGATVEGSFNRYTVAIWLDRRFAPKGYGYFIPLSEKEANIVIAYPDYPSAIDMDIEVMWELFYQRACKDLQQSLRITDRFEVTRYVIGTCRHPRIGNTFFTGNCFGSIMPFFGFGQFSAILTGIYAAESLVDKSKSYEKLTKPIMRSYKNSLVLRHAIEKLDNPKYDTLVRMLKTSAGNKLFNTGHYDPLKYISYVLRPFIRNNRGGQ